MLPCSASERQVLLVAASIAEGIPVDLREAALDLDAANAARVARAVCHAAGSGCRPGRRAAGDRAAADGDDHPSASPAGRPGASGTGRDAPAWPPGTAAGTA